MVEIPQNNSADLIAAQNIRHQERLDTIAKQFIKGLERDISSDITCAPHMVGRYSDCHPLSDTIEVAKQFKEKGYYCYYCDYYNNHSVRQCEVVVRKTPMPAGDIRFANGSWHQI